jgi:hypothetical protein
MTRKRKPPVPSHKEAKRIIAPYTEAGIRSILERGRSDPEALSPEEIKVASAYVWLREMRTRN